MKDIQNNILQIGKQRSESELMAMFIRTFVVGCVFPKWRKFDVLTDENAESLLTTPGETSALQMNGKK